MIVRHEGLTARVSKNASISIFPMFPVPIIPMFKVSSLLRNSFLLNNMNDVINL